MEKIGRLDMLHQFFNADVAIIDEGNASIHYFERLCGIMLVAIPTAIPLDPLIIIEELRVGNNSRFPFRIIEIQLEVDGFFIDILKHVASQSLHLASVYRMAAGPSPSWLPKFPCPIDKCVAHISIPAAIRTMASYTAVSPCG